MKADLGPARPSDREAVLDMCARLHPGGDYVADAWDSWMREGTLRVARGPGGPVGACGVSVRSGEAWMEGLRVDGRLHRRGVGHSLVADAASSARSRGASVMRAFVQVGNSASRSLALKAGFEPSGAWTWYALSGSGAEPRPARPRELRGLRLDSWRAFRSGGAPLFLEGCACALAPARHFAGTLLVTVMEGTDLSGLAGYLESESPRWPQRRMSGWTSGIHVASALDPRLFAEFFEPRFSFELFSLDLQTGAGL